MDRNRYRLHVYLNLCMFVFVHTHAYMLSRYIHSDVPNDVTEAVLSSFKAWSVISVIASSRKP